MQTLSKPEFYHFLIVSPQRFIGKLIKYHGAVSRILDVSIGGNLIHLESLDPLKPGTEWVPGFVPEDINGDIDVENTDPPLKYTDPFTVVALLNSRTKFEDYVGHPSSEQEKPLFEIVKALNMEILGLKLKVEELEKKQDYAASS